MLCKRSNCILSIIWSSPSIPDIWNARSPNSNAFSRVPNRVRNWKSLLEQLAAALPAKQGSRPPAVALGRPHRIRGSRPRHPFFANDKLTYASTPKKDFVVDNTIAQLEETLDPAKFVRIHRSTIVNIEFVKELYSWFSERMMVRMNDGKDTELTVARERVRTLKERLGLYS